MTNGEIDNLNQRFKTLTDMVSEAHRLFRCDCLSTSTYELERIRRFAGQLQATIDDHLHG